MWILPLLGYVGLLLGFLFLTLSIASGLYYLSEIVEEHSVLSSKVLRRLIYTVMASLSLLWLVDGFPLHLIAMSFVSHGVYLGNLRHFPVVKLQDPIFLLSCGLVILNHWAWFRFFSKPDAFTKPRRGGANTGNVWSSGYNYYDQPSFTEIASYFGLCVWLVPFALFVSLSAGENVLPSMGSEYATGDPHAGSGGFKKGHKRRNTGLAKAAVGNMREWMGETGAVMGLWKKDNVKAF